PGGPSTPIDIAKGRYARGDISREQFEALKKDLND
ncbi:MAG: Short C-terminal domain, partial [Dehalococcoidia bacterium]|nr:Short C-terminal domain [Dehalococcoidia bacterium]